ncbi:aminotransferase class IV [Phenylobacterium sp.]|uniref:aminotransferase class IV n=1 Tax=Phenylobacterium sp. TaxID=1871053 RepID=UPI002DE233D2|nr:aminotransferase class IV [Phenylobacterium sp.]
MIPKDDRGFALGDGLFETVLAEAGALRRLDDHLDRMTAGCAVLGLPAPDRAAAERLMIQALGEAGLAGARAAVRLTWTAGGGGRGLDRPQTLQPRMVATAAPAPKPAGPARLMVSAVRRNERSPTSRLKTLAYLDNVLARRAARAAGADEALMLDTGGRVACAAAANLFWLRDGRLFTPALDCGVLAGLARARVIAAARGRGLGVEEVAEGAEILAAAQAVFLTNSLIGVRPVAAIGDRTYEESRLVDVFANVLAES